MQQTKLDHWLKEKFLYETHIFTMRLLEDGFGRGVSVTDISDQGKGAYNYKIVVKSKKRADKVVALLKENHLMYATHVVEGDHWYKKFIAPDGASFTYRWIMRTLGLVCLLSFAWGIYLLLQHADLVKSTKEMMKEFEIFQ